MELTLAILMALGIFVGVPAIVGFTIVGTYTLAARKARKVEHHVKAAIEAELQKV